MDGHACDSGDEEVFGGLLAGPGVRGRPAADGRCRPRTRARHTPWSVCSSCRSVTGRPRASGLRSPRRSQGEGSTRACGSGCKGSPRWWLSSRGGLPRPAANALAMGYSILRYPTLVWGRLLFAGSPRRPPPPPFPPVLSVPAGGVLPCLFSMTLLPVGTTTSSLPVYS